jgi:hypothetical protein
MGGTVLDTSSWQRKALRVLDELHLDPMNVRLETASAQVEADIVEDLFDNENAFDLVEAIAKIGYLTHEIPIAVKRRGKYVVVEGNRRLAALKAIQNPMIVPTYQARISALAKSMGKNRDRLASIEVLVAPNQTQADQLIAALHTSNPRKAWSPARQAAFFQAQIDAKRKYAQLVSRYPTIDVADFVLRARLVNRLKEAVASEPDLVDFIGSKDWKSGFSALTRIFESKDFRSITGIALDADGMLTTEVSAKDFDAAALLIVQGMQDRTINTRTIGTVSSPRFTRLMSDIRAAVGTESPKDTSTGGDEGTSSGSSGGANSGAGGAESSRAGGSGNAGGSRSGTSSGTKKPAKKPTKRQKQTTLDLGHIAASPAYPNAIQLHLEELSLLNIQRLPNSAFLLMRATLEKSIKAYAEAIGVPDIGATKHGLNGRAQLHNCLNWFIDHVTINGPKTLVDPAKKVQGGRLSDYTGTRAALNALNHNHHFAVDGDDVVSAWNSIDSIMRELMKP